ncbi:hypothetical protein CCACVL1_23616, partial [Corchorus capsularis]
MGLKWKEIFWTLEQLGKKPFKWDTHATRVPRVSLTLTSWPFGHVR